MNISTQSANHWNTRGSFIMAFLCMTLNMQSTLSMPNTATNMGTIGCTLLQICSFIFIGAPLLYMEMILGQFTSRDCIDIWKIRPCLSHIGYVLAFWQFMTLVSNHILTSFIFHYQMIVFERPVPFYDCKSFPPEHCNILHTNRTVNEDCSRYDRTEPYCETLYKTYPEHLYWRITLLKHGSERYTHVSWRVCLTSCLVCVITFLSCFKKNKSMQWFLYIYTVYPVIGYMIIMTGSMVQKGMVEKYEDALDMSFTVFKSYSRISHIVPQVSLSLMIGSGLVVTLTSTDVFRSPTHSNASVIVVVSTAFAVLASLTSAMVVCPYAYDNDIKVYTYMKNPMTFIFEKMPRLFESYSEKYLWLNIFFSTNLVLGLGTNTIIFYCLLYMATQRIKIVRDYPGLATFVGVLVLFILTIPFMGPLGGVLLVNCVQRFSILIQAFVVFIECFVFVLWYGMGRFSEDVHFMEGVRPNFFKKVMWTMASIISVWLLWEEMASQFKVIKNRLNDILGWVLLLMTMSVITWGVLLRLVVAGFRHNLRALLALDATWGPRSELRRRSREMFSAQAMTKEYVYRQNQLQAGIVARQRRANVRNPIDVSERRNII